MKIVLIGGGSFVFAPTVLEDVIVKHRLADSEEQAAIEEVLNNW